MGACESVSAKKTKHFLLQIPVCWRLSRQNEILQVKFLKNGFVRVVCVPYSHSYIRVSSVHVARKTFQHSKATRKSELDVSKCSTLQLFMLKDDFSLVTTLNFCSINI